MEDEKKAEKTLSEDAWKKAINSWKSQTQDTDFDEFETPLRKDVVDKLYQVLKKHSGN